MTKGYLKCISHLVWALCISLCLLAECSMAQQSPDTLPLRKRHYSYDKIFSTNHTNFILRLNAMLPAKTGFKNTSDLRIDAGIDFGILIGWMYQFNFKKRWGLQTGLQGEMDFEHENLFISKRYSHLPDDYHIPYSNLGVASINLPVYACYYVPFHDRREHWLANFKLGVDLRYGTDFNGSEIYGTTTSYTYEDPVSARETALSSLTVRRKHRSIFYNSFYASAGINYILPNKRMLNIQVVGNYSPFFQKTFEYVLMPGAANEARGSFTRSYSYIGFELNYILTSPYRMGKAKKRAQ
ncbi:MAG: hypothetical protein JSS76_17265 [Bacteroidetes bacterium]|nr:hypothetical protein [Bacteroidota bacterium]